MSHPLAAWLRLQEQRVDAARAALAAATRAASEAQEALATARARLAHAERACAAAAAGRDAWASARRRALDRAAEAALDDRRTPR